MHTYNYEVGRTDRRVGRTDCRVGRTNCRGKQLYLYFYFTCDNNFIYESGFTLQVKKFKRFATFRPCGPAKVLLNELKKYFRGELQSFSIFKNIYFNSVKEIDYKIYKYLTENVKFGNVITYKRLSEIFKIHPRNVGAIMRNNKTPLIIPCHRVIMSDGSSGGYLGKNTYIKRFLLLLEGVPINLKSKRLNLNIEFIDPTAKAFSQLSIESTPLLKTSTIKRSCFI